MKPTVLDSVDPEWEIASADLFAPVTSIIRVDQIENAIGIINRSDYRLAASVFGPEPVARQMASRLQVGSVALNDLIVPTADPRLPFGGRGKSGFGVTRGEEGLLAMSVPKVVSRRRGSVLPHLQPRRPRDEGVLLGALQVLYGDTMGRRWKGIRTLLSRKQPWREGDPPDDATPNEALSLRKDES